MPLQLKRITVSTNLLLVLLVVVRDTASAAGGDVEERKVEGEQHPEDIAAAEGSPTHSPPRQQQRQHGTVRWLEKEAS